MKKTKKSKRLKQNQLQNPVAKYAFHFNKAKIFKDKTKYQRKPKHKAKESFPMQFTTVLERVSGFLFRNSNYRNYSHN